MTKYVSWANSRHILCKQYQINSEMTSNAADLLRKGLTSEYFLASFLEKDPSRYRLAQVVQNKMVGKPETSKSYGVIEKLTDAHYLVEKNERCYPNLEKLVDTIDSSSLRTWQEPLDPDEKYTLVGMLQNREFFKVVSDEILEEMHNQPFRIHNIDALETIANKIGLLTTAIILYKTYALNVLQESNTKPAESLKQTNEEQKDFGIVWDEMVIPDLKEVAFERKLTKKAKEVQKQLMKIYKEQKKNAKGVEKDSVSKPQNIMMISDAIMIFLKSLPSLRAFLFVPEKTLWKLCKLWEGYGMFEFAMKFK